MTEQVNINIQELEGANPSAAHRAKHTQLVPVGGLISSVMQTILDGLKAVENQSPDKVQKGALDKMLKVHGIDASALIAVQAGLDPQHPDYEKNVRDYANIHASLQASYNKAFSNRGRSLGSHRGLGATPPDWPSGSGQKNPFNPNASSNESNGDIYSKFNLWWHYLMQNGLNFAALVGFIQWIMNEAQTNGNKSAVKKILAALGMDGKSSSGSLAGTFIQMLMMAWFFQKGGGSGKLTEEMAKLKAYIDAIAAKFPNTKFFQELKYWTDQDSKNLATWIAKFKKEGLTPDEFKFKLEGMMLNFFLGNPFAKKIGHEIFMDSVDHYITEFEKNPAVLIGLIFGTFGLNMNELQENMGADGDLNAYLKELNKKLSEIESEFSKAENAPPHGLNGNDLKKLFSDITQLLYQVDELAKLYGPTIVNQTNSAFSKLLNTSFKYKGKTITFKQLLSDKQYQPIDWGAVADACNKQHIFYNPGDPKAKPPVPAGPTELTKDTITQLQTTGQAYTSKVQTISTEMSKISQQIQTLQSIIQTMTTTYYSQNWIGQIVKNEIVVG